MFKTIKVNLWKDETVTALQAPTSSGDVKIMSWVGFEGLENGKNHTMTVVKVNEDMDHHPSTENNVSPDESDMTRTVTYIDEEEKEEQQDKVETRVCVQTWDGAWTIEEQWMALSTRGEQHPEAWKRIQQEVRKKQRSYLYQDKKKQRFHVDAHIEVEDLLTALLDTKMQCHYCQDSVHILYTNRLDPKQWTMDRVDNQVGHNRHNLHIACLQCNLQRRRCNDEKFKEAKIVQGVEKIIVEK